MASYLSCHIAGEELWCLGEKALFWPQQKTLVVADLHWGKAETFQKAGIPVPQTGFAQDLARLTRLLTETKAERLLILGDLIHSPRGLTDDLYESVTSWRKQLHADVLWIEGNHDQRVSKVPESWDMQRIVGDWCEGPFRFTHEPKDSKDGLFSLCGHIHPVVQLKTRLDRLRLPCFWFEATLGVLPAFGYFTGGAEIRPSSRGQVFAIAEGKVWDIGYRPTPIDDQTLALRLQDVPSHR